MGNDDLRRTLLVADKIGAQRSLTSTVRGALAVAGRIARGAEPVSVVLGKIVDLENFLIRETSTWLEPNEVEDGRPGPFDAADLRCYLVIAEKAGVPAIPAVEILRLDEEEYSFLSGQVEIPETRGMKALVGRITSEMGQLRDESAPRMGQSDLQRLAHLRERLMDAMDMVPDTGWMVRHHRAGPGSLKALAGCGVIDNVAPEVRFGPNLEVGPGWVRVGNRRLVDVADARLVQLAVGGKEGAPTVFLARPWVTASRWVEADDVVRAKSPIAGIGKWPCEYRAFIEDGVCVGVSFYYAWAGRVTVRDANAVIEVRRLAQKMADHMVASKQVPRHSTLEVARHTEATQQNHELTVENQLRRQAVRRELNRFQRDKVACTLDFIETNEGFKLLEGGPTNMFCGGGHPCGFAGQGGLPITINPTRNHGVAFKVMDGVDITDMSTWGSGDPHGSIFSWEEVEALASMLPTIEQERIIAPIRHESLEIEIGSAP